MDRQREKRATGTAVVRVGIALVGLALPACRAGVAPGTGEEATTGRRGALSPAANSVTFYQSYDHGSTVDLDGGGPLTPREGDPFISATGLFGPAVDGATTPGLSYVDSTGEAIDLSKPGSVSFWVKADAGYMPACFFISFNAYSRTNLFVCDHGDTLGIAAEVYFNQGTSPDPILQEPSSGVSPRSWAGDGQWHLVVVNWAPSALAFSIDGGPLSVKPVNWLDEPHVYGPDLGDLIYAGGSTSGYAKDELMVLNRPMTSDEIQWYYAQRTIPMLTNPAPAHFNADGNACSTPDDMNPCTIDGCDVTGVTHTAVTDGAACGQGGSCGRPATCQSGTCVQSGPTPCAGQNHVTFYRSFDQGTTADIAATTSTPSTDEPLAQTAGLFGMAEDPTWNAWQVYETSANASPSNIDLWSPGSVSMWVKPDGQFAYAEYFMATDLAANLTLYVSASPTSVTAQMVGVVSNWVGWTPDNRWHLIVVNWSRTGIGLSVDGAPMAVQSTADLQNIPPGAGVGNDIYPNLITAGSSKDELIVMNRPMSNEEIQWYYAQRGTSATTNPAVDHFNNDGATCNPYDDLNPCTAHACDPSGGVTHAPRPDGTACDDASSSVGNGVCEVGQCQIDVSPCPPFPGVCMGPGTRDVTTGTCTYSPLPDHTPCNDGNACTQTDSCQAGSCVGTNPVVCAPSGGGQCQDAGTCNPSTGLCVNLPVPDGFACNDGNPCTQSDACQNGTCVGGDPVVCASADQCHLAGSCDPGTGACTNPAVADGTPCDDGSACTTAESCQAGTCSGGQSSCAFLTSPTTGQPIAMPRFEEIGFFVSDADDEFPTGINSVGDVVGYEVHANGGQTFAWKHTNLGVQYFSPESGSMGFGINDAGTIVGTVDLGANPMRSHTAGQSPNVVFVSEGKAFVELNGTFDILTQNSGKTMGINGNGVMAVNEILPDGFSGAAIVPTTIGLNSHPVGQFTGDPFTGSMVALGIGPGATPELVGMALTGPPPPLLSGQTQASQAFSFSEKLGLQNLNKLGAYTTRSWLLETATATNGRQIVGSGSFLEGLLRKCHAYRFNRMISQQSAAQSPPPLPSLPGTPSPTLTPEILNPGNSVTDLGTLPRYGDGECNAQNGNYPYRARAINSRGEVVGDVTPGATLLSGPGGAFFYSDATGMLDLTELLDPSFGYAVRTATGINDNGQIVGTFTKPGETQLRAYRLTLPPNFTAGPTAQFDWRMQPHFPGMDRPTAPPPPIVDCPPAVSSCGADKCPKLAPCSDAQGNPGCFVPQSNTCLVTGCQPGAIASCRTSCGSVGSETCTAAGSWGPCQVSYEVCDGQDNDCNGQIDDGGVCTLPFSAVHPNERGFDATLDATLSQSSKRPIASCSWVAVVLSGPSVQLMTATGCVTTMTFPAEGVYPVQLTVTTTDGSQATETHNIVIRNVIIASIGDSIASGEGSPDAVAVWENLGVEFGVARPPIWWNRRCHRSLLSGPALTARALENADSRSSVTFISRACSGAGVQSGLLGPYGGEEKVAPTVPGTVGDGDTDENLRPQIDAVKALLAGRQVDGLMVQAGANDAGFADIIRKCAHPEGTGKLFPLGCDARKIGGLLIAQQLATYDYPMLAEKLAGLAVGPSRVYVADYPDPMHVTADTLCDGLRIEGAVADATDGWNTVLEAATLGQTFGDDALLDADDVKWASEMFLPALNSSVSSNATAKGWTHVTGINDKFVGRAFCQPTRAFVQYSESRVKQLNNQGVFHPNITGQQIYGSQLCPTVARDLGLSSTYCPVVF